MSVKESPGYTDKDIQCEECGKAFIRNYTLQCHMLIHKGVKDFKCEECGMVGYRSYLDPKGGVVCYKCSKRQGTGRSKGFTDVTDRVFQDIASKEIKIKCVNSDCSELLTVDSLYEHERDCQHSTFRCQYFSDHMRDEPFNS